MPSAPSYGAIKDAAELQKLVDKLLADNVPFGFDIETGYEGSPRDGASLHPEEGMVVGCSFSNDPSWARYIPLNHETARACTLEEFVDITRPLFWSGLGVAHNAKFELRFLSLLEGSDEQPLGYFPVYSDTMIEAYILAEWTSIGLKALTKEVFGHEQAEISTLFPELAKGKLKSMRFNTLDLSPQVVAYACEDAAWCLALHQKHYPRVKDNFLFKVEMQVLPILCQMEAYGVLYDWELMNRYAAEAATFLAKLDSEIQAELSAMTGEPVNINLGSSKQIGDILFGKLGMKSAQKTGTGKDSTSAIALAALAKKHSVVQRILEWKEVKKLHSTYLAKYPQVYSYAPDGRTHPNILQTAVGTGRFAVSDPPYQQTPKKYKYKLDSGAEFVCAFRNIIKAGKDHYLLGYDYSQVELRWLAGESQEPTLIDDFENDRDVHVATASLMLGVPRDQVTADQRAIGKTMNFALLYGMGPKSLADRLAISKDRAIELYDQYFQSFSAISVWVDRQKEMGKQRGYTISKFGRRFTIWEFQSHDAWIYSKGERLCVNAPIQGGAADYMKVAMVRANQALEKAGLLDKVHLIMNIHDALVFECHKSVSPQQVFDVVRPAVEFKVEGFPKIVSDWSLGFRWGEMKDLKPDANGILRRPDQVSSSVPSSSSATEAAPAGGDAGPGPEAAPAHRSEPKYVPDRKHDFVGAEGENCAECGGGEDGLLHNPRPKLNSEQKQDAIDAREAIADGALDNLEPGKRLIVELSDMPDTAQWEKFIDYCAQHRGRNRVLLRTPEGDLDLDTLGVSLTPHDSSDVSLIFGGAALFFDSDSVEAASVVAGLSL